jgi:K+-transporting ATPase ATPase A chain
MTGNGTLQILLYLIIILVLVKPLGLYMGLVFEGKRSTDSFFLSKLEKAFYRCCGINASHEMNWKTYLIALLSFNLLGILLLYALQRLQFYLPLNPQHFAGVSPDLSFNTAASFTTNTDWQAYGGESTLSYLTQMLGMTVQNFLSAASGIALMLVLIRGLARHETSNLGNFWVDTVRSVVYILLPLALIFSVMLVSQGVIQNFKPYETATLVQPLDYSATPGASTTHLTQQVLPMGPVASQVAIKQLGTNGGGFFNTNSSHPYENPTPLSNLLEMLAILLIPAALCYTFGYLVGDRRQGWAILIAMLVILIPLIFADYAIEQGGNPALTSLSVKQDRENNTFPGGNMEGKETRFGIVNSTLWNTTATATGNGSTNSAMESYMPLGGMIPLLLMQLGEVIFGGVGSGVAGMLMFVIMTVFIAGLMVGRTPEYLGKKISPFEVKMTSFIVLVVPLVILLFSTFSVVSKTAISSLANPGAHGFTSILYAFSSMTENNGSSFAGLNANTPFFNIAGGIAILVGRFWTAIPILAMAGSLARKKIVPASAGTLPTDTFLFVVLLVCVVLIVGALTFLPALALGPIVEELMLRSHYVS